MASTNSIETFDFFINRFSGTVLRAGEQEIEKKIREEFKEKTGNITFINGSEIKTSVTEWINNRAAENKGIIIGGGDGTVLSAAGTVIDSKATNVNFGILPLGTQNLLSNHLGLSADFNQAVTRYKNTITTELDIGKVNGQYFVYGLLLDKNSYKFYDGRELLREKKYLKALKFYASWAMGTLFGKKTKLEVSYNGAGLIDLKPARFIALTNNKINPKKIFAPNDNPNKLRGMFQNMVHKNLSNDGRLTLYSLTNIKKSPFSLFRTIINGSWTKHQSVSISEAYELIIQPKSSEKNTRIVLDGEIKNLFYPLKVSLIKKAIKLIKPV